MGETTIENFVPQFCNQNADSPRSTLVNPYAEFYLKLVHCAHSSTFFIPISHAVIT